MKILLIVPYRGIGDLIFHLPIIRYLKNKYKNKIYLLINPKSKAKEILKNEKSIKKIIYTRFDRVKLINNSIDLVKKINRINPNLSILTAPSKRLKIALYLSNSKNKIYFQKNTNKDLSKYLAHEGKIRIGMKNFNQNYNLNVINNFKYKKKYIFLNIDSHHNQNNWGEKNFMLLTKKLIDRKYFIFINFSPNNKKFFKKTLFLFKGKKEVLFTYKKNLTEILKIILKCNFIVGNESGPICIGASMKKKIISLINPSTTYRSSKTIHKKVIFFNTSKFNAKSIEKKILTRLVKK
mgnify:CR=1 FL=1